MTWTDFILSFIADDADSHGDYLRNVAPTVTDEASARAALAIIGVPDEFVTMQIASLQPR